MKIKKNSTMTQDEFDKLNLNYLKSVERIASITKKTPQYLVDELEAEIINVGINTVYCVVGTNVRSIKSRLARLSTAVDTMVKGIVDAAIKAMLDRVDDEKILMRKEVDRIIEYFSHVYHCVDAIGDVFVGNQNHANFDLITETLEDINLTCFQLSQFAETIPTDDFFARYDISLPHYKKNDK